MSNIYPASTSDRTELQRMDIWCYDYPLDFNSWGEILGTKQDGEYVEFKCETLKRNGTILSYGVYSTIPVSEEDGEDLLVLRIGVMPSLREQGLGTMMVDHLHNKALDMKLRRFQIRIPEYYLDPEERASRGDVHKFALTSGLYVHRLESEAYLHYGKLYDGIIYRSGGIQVPVTAAS